MERRKQERQPTAAIDRALIEKAFTQTLTEDLGAVIILDGIDELPAGYQIRRHDLKGPLPDILIPRSESWELRQAVEREACRLYAISKDRENQ